MTLSTKIVLARRKKGYTQEVLAEMSNLSLSTIQRIEKGKISPRAYTIKTLSEVLELEAIEIQFSTNNNSNLEKEENNVFKITFYAIILVFIPLINSIIPYNIWSKNRKSAIINTFGKKVFLFQTVSSISLIILLFLVPMLSYTFTGQKAYGQLNLPLLVYLLFILTNIITLISLYNKAIKKINIPITPH